MRSVQIAILILSNEFSKVVEKDFKPFHSAEREDMRTDL